MKYSHAIGLVVLSVFGMIGLGEAGVMPYSFSIPVVLVVVVLSGFYWKSPDWFEGGKKGFGGGDFAVNPQNALQWLQNDYIPSSPGYKKLNLDTTSKDNMKLHTDIQKVNENGEQKVKFGVVGAPLNQIDKESIGYIVHCNTGYVEYNGERHDSDSRLNPIQRNKQWLVSKGFNAKVEGDGQKKVNPSSVNIYQGSKPEDGVNRQVEE